LEGNVNYGTDFGPKIKNKITEIFSNLPGYEIKDIGIDVEREKVKDYNECIQGECTTKYKEQGIEWVVQATLSMPNGLCEITLSQSQPDGSNSKTTSGTRSCSSEDIGVNLTNLVYDLIRNVDVKSSGDRKIKIDSNPSGAVLYVNGERIGKTPLETSIKAGSVKFKLIIEGSDRFEEPNFVKTIPDGSDLLDLGIIDIPKSEAYIIFNINPPEAFLNAQVIVDGKILDREELKKHTVDFGKRIDIEVSAPKFATYHKTIPALMPKQEYKLPVNLEANPCKLTLNSSPSGAEVFEGENKLGTTPYRSDIAPGTSRFIIKKPFYSVEEKEIFCKPGEVVDRNVNMKWVEYSQEDQEKIDRAADFRKYSYYGFALSAGLAYLSYSKVGDFKKYDDQYKNSTNPSEIESAKLQRESAKKSISLFTAAAVVSLGSSAVLYKLGEFPADVIKSSPITFIPENKGVQLVWHISW
jgi:hypothetical protein